MAGRRARKTGRIMILARSSAPSVDPVAREPRGHHVGLEAHEPSDLHERDASLGHEPTHVAFADRQPRGKALRVKKFRLFRNLCG